MTEYCHRIEDLGPKLDDLRKKGLFCDVHIVFQNDERKIYAHKNILASCSRYFQSLLCYDNKTTSGITEVCIPDINYADFEAIVQFAYTQKADLSPKNIESVIVTADRFNVLGLLTLCCDYLLGNIDNENAIGIYKLARSLQLPSLVTWSWRFILDNFVPISLQSNELLYLSSDELTQIFKDDELNVSHEDEACKALIRWFHIHDKLPFLEKLLSSLRLGMISKSCYEDLMSTFKNLPKSKEAITLINDGYDLAIIRPTQYQNPLIARSNPLLRPRVPREVLFVLGGWAKAGVCADMESLDVRVMTWYENSNAKYEHPIAYFALVAYDKNNIFVIGGYTNVQYLNTMKSFDPETKQWTSRAPMHESRCYVCAAELNGYIYACGGYDGQIRHSSVERYDPQLDEWVMVARMNSVRSDAGACSAGGKLYVAGGFSGHDCLNCIECYDPRTNQWTVLPNMRFKRSGVELVSFQDDVYALGGFNGHVRLGESEQFHTSSQMWHPIKSMKTGRSNFAAAVIDRKLFAIGGYDGTKTTDRAEYYDFRVGEWFSVDNLRIGRSAAGACTVAGLKNTRDFTFHGQEEIVQPGDNENATTSYTIRTRARAKRTARPN